MIIVGTAGHIDHGKSSIVKRLTGTDPDRLPEEKARGMTIDLGFAFLGLPSGETIGFIDVPGHERFVKNMVSGAGGIDAVLLVIAADDGWMPQSEEHFQIVRLLGVTRGIIAVNKIDLVQPDWLELLIEEIRRRVRDTFLAEAPIVAVSAETGVGFEHLRSHLEALADDTARRPDIGAARLYVDRSFVRPGIGGVVTGTLRDSSLTAGQSIMLWPSLETGKIRTLHSNNADVERVGPGQRTAASFTGIDREELGRGSVVTTREDLEFLRDNPILALDLEVLTSAPVMVDDGREVILIVGTSEVAGVLRLLDDKAAAPGDRVVCFFRPAEPLLALVGDHFIMRLPTPMLTIGGGQVLDHLAAFPRKKDRAQFVYLHERRPLTLSRAIKSELHKSVLCPADELLRHSAFAPADIEAAIKRLFHSREVGLFQGAVFRPDLLKPATEASVEAVRTWLEARTHVRGIGKDDLTPLLAAASGAPELMLKYLIAESLLVEDGELYNLPGRGMTLKGPVKQAYDELMRLISAEPMAPPGLMYLSGKGKVHREAIRYMLESGQVHKCGQEFLFLADVWFRITDFIRTRLKSAGEVTIADLRDQFGFSRKYAVPILEETDRLGLTRRDGDRRIKGAKFE